MRKSSYRLGRRLKASAKARRDYITYLQSQDAGGDGSTRPPGTALLSARFAAGGVFGAAVRIIQLAQMGAALGGDLRVHIFPPITLRSGAALGGAMVATARIIQRMAAGISGGGAASVDVSSSPALTVIAAMDPAPSPLRAAAITELVDGLVSAGIWSKLDCLYVTAAHTQQAATLNWKDPDKYTLTAVGTPGFTADDGVFGGSNSGWSSGYVPSVDGVNFTRDDAMVMVATAETTLGTTYYELGLVDPSGNIGIRVRASSGEQAPWAILNGPVVSPLAPADYPTGFATVAAVRSSATVVRVYMNGVQTSADTGNSSVGLSSLAIGVGGRVYDTGEMVGTTRPVTAACWGSTLSPAELANLHNLLSDYQAATDPDAIAVISAMAVEPTPERARAIERTIRDLKDAGVWSELDSLFVLAAHTQQAALINWKKPSTPASVAGTGSVIFEPNVGMRSDGTAYLNSNSGFGPKYTATGATLFAKLGGTANPANPSQNECVLGLGDNANNNASFLMPVIAALPLQMRGRLNRAANTDIVRGAGIDSLVAFTASGTATIGYSDGLWRGSDTSNAVSVAPGMVGLLGWASDGTAFAHNVTNPLQVAGWGGSLTSAQHAALNTAVKNYASTL